MELNNIDISKLPSDIRRQFKQLQVLHAEKKIQNKAKDDFLSFVKCMWPDFIEGSHHRHIADKFNKLASGEINRLIINMPPRHTKSEFASYLLPAWMVGREPKLKIIQKFLKQDYKKIVKQQDVGRQHKAVNTLQLVLVVRSPDVVQSF